MLHSLWQRNVWNIQTYSVKSKVCFYFKKYINANALTQKNVRVFCVCVGRLPLSCIVNKWSYKHERWYCWNTVGLKNKLICFQILTVTSGIHICLKIMKLKFIWPLYVKITFVLVLRNLIHLCFFCVIKI